MTDEYDLRRFMEAQAPVYGDAIASLRCGRMRTPYMDFIFPRFPDRTARDVFGEVGARKLHSSLTLFVEASNDEPLLSTMLHIWFDKRLDEETMARLGECSFGDIDRNRR